MLRKVTLTGLLIFVSRGTVFQLTVTTCSCICFLGLAAWFQPYESPAVNLFKVSTEITLLLTLVIAALLKVDLAGEKLPDGIAAPDGQGVDEDEVGLVLFIANTAVPAAGMVLGYIEFGWNAKDAKVSVLPLFSRAMHSVCY